MVILPAEECPLSIKCSAQAAKSSNTFCLLCRDPALRQSMPYSPPPLDAHSGLEKAASRLQELGSAQSSLAGQRAA